MAVFLALLTQLAAEAQPMMKQALVEGNGAPLVLLHGGTQDYTAYAVHSKLLADSFTVIRLQQFNVQYANEGRTLPKDYSVKMESEAIKATLDSLHISKPVILVGHSYGGVVAFDFAMRHPEKVQSLVLVEAPLYDMAKAKGEYSKNMEEINGQTKHFTSQAIITEEMIKDFRCSMTNCDTFDIRSHPMWSKWVKQKDRLRGLSVVSSYKIDFEKLHSFKKPVLIVTGTTTIEPNKTIDKLLSREFSNVKAASLPGDHIAVYQKPEAFVQVLKVFLQNNGY
ncbi:MAG: alpha/beta hydrolase [Chitinophagaceae bacterium]|nr:alpha/beta hydrolase [Chitinophagaceae bacterium]